MKNWGFIGAGKMATALIQGMLRAGIAPRRSHLRQRPARPRPAHAVQPKPASPCSSPISTSSSTATSSSWR